MEIKIEIPDDIYSDKDRLKVVEQGIVKAVSKACTKRDWLSQL
jgi:hypothetical protein